MPRPGYVYILATDRRGTLYTGVTSHLIQRVWQHREELHDGFTKRYGVHRLVYYEVHGKIGDAIAREKQVKGWRRAWKLQLVEEMNPGWDDLYPALVGENGFPLSRE